MSAKRQSILASGIGFDETDLLANRSGRLTPRQIDRVRQNRKQSTYGVTALLLMAAVSLVGMVVVGIFVSQRLDLLWLVAAVTLGLTLYFMAVRGGNRRFQTDLERRQVEAVQGAVQCFTSNTRSAPAEYNLRVGDITFRGVRQETYLAFRHLDVYTLYYLPESKTIVSAEIVADSSE